MSYFPEPKGPFVLLCGPGDTNEALWHRIETTFENLQTQVADDESIEFKSWRSEKSKSGVDQWYSPQLDFPLPSSPQCKGIVFIFGERLGSELRLPEELPLHELIGNEPSDQSGNREYLKTSFNEGDEQSGAFPLTGTVFECLVAMAANEKAGQPKEGKPPFRIFIIGDESLFKYDNDKLRNANWGNRHFYEKARNHYQTKQLYAEFDTWIAEEYTPQLRQLKNFIYYLKKRMEIKPVSESDLLAETEKFFTKRIYPSIILGKSNPFKGLAYYDVDDKDVFFGRKEWLKDNIPAFEALWTNETKNPFFGIIGGSGAGKSSLMRAGIIARLREKHPYKTITITTNDLFPREHHIHSEEFDPHIPIAIICEKALLELGCKREAERMSATIAHNIPAACKYLLEKLNTYNNGVGYRLVIGLDQFEEIIDYQTDQTNPQNRDKIKPLFDFFEQTLATGRIGYIYTCQINRIKLRNKDAVLKKLVGAGIDQKVEFPSKEEIKKIIKGCFQKVKVDIQEDYIEEIYGQVDNFKQDVQASVKSEGGIAAAQASLMPLLSMALLRVYNKFLELKSGIPPNISDESKSNDGAEKSHTNEFRQKAAAEEKMTLGLNKETKQFINIEKAISELGDQSLSEVKETPTIAWSDETLNTLLRRLVRIQMPTADNDDADASDTTASNIHLYLPTTAIPKRGVTYILAQTLLEKRLLLPVGQGLMRLSHEAVVMHWPPARKWLQDEQGLLEIAKKLLLSAISWDQNGRKKDYLKEIELEGVGNLLRSWFDVLSPNDGSIPNKDSQLLLDYSLSLLEAKSDPDYPVVDKEGKSTHFLTAASYGATELVKKYIAGKPSIVKKHRTSKLANAVYCAAFGNEETLRFILHSGADPNQPNKEGWLPIHVAANLGHQEMLDTLIHYKANPLETGPNDNTVLHLAAQNGNFNIMSSMFKKYNPDPNLPTVDGWTPLHMACRFGNDNIVSLLLEKQANPNLPNKNGWTAFHIACRYGNMALLDILLSHSSIDPVYTVNERYWIPLQLAIYNGSTEVVQRLLHDARIAREPQYPQESSILELAINENKMGILQALLNDPYKKINIERLGKTALNKAVEYKHVEAMRILLEHRDKIDITSEGNWNTLLTAAIKDNIDTLKLLLHYPDIKQKITSPDSYNETALHKAAEYGNANAVQLLLEKYRANANLQSNPGSTPLHIAIKKGSETICLLLIDHTDLGIADNEGNTSLHLAAKSGNINILTRLLHKSKNELKRLNDDGFAPIHIAARKTAEETVSLFIEQDNQQVIFADANGRIPLHHAVEKNHKALIESLISFSPVDSPDFEGMTPLHLAAQYNLDEVIEQLVNKGADINGGDRYGWTPLHIAAQNGAALACRTLLKLGANVDTFSIEPELTPLQAAAETGQINVINLLIEKQADLWAESLNREPAAVLAMQYAHYDVARQLLEQMGLINE